MTKQTQNFGLNSAKLIEITAHDFFNDSLRLYSAHSNVRGIPFIGDGFKEAQRKAMWGMLDRGENAGLISVERVSAHCAAATDYHHGIGSMQGTIAGLAQDFAGSNNVNFLVPEGQFGSRRSHGTSAARYIETKIHENFRKIFMKEDDIILEQRRAGDLKIEPKYFIPLLPVVLLNGAEGMGTGHATHIFSYKPDDLKQAILKILDGKKLTDHELTPWWNDFKGKVERDKTNGQVKVTGDFTVINSTEIRVTELPVGTQSDKYEEILFRLEDQEKVKSFKNASDDTGFDFILKVPRTTTVLQREELIKVLKLEARDTENLTVWNPDGVIEKYESVEKLLAAFVDWRLKRYEDRRQKYIELTSAQIAWLEEVIRFINFYLANTQKFRDTGKKDLLELLNANKFTQPERLLGMSIWSLTRDHIEDSAKKLEFERKKLADLQVDQPVKMYKRELAALKL
jgi:DNA topoisomerase-2